MLMTLIDSPVQPNSPTYTWPVLLNTILLFLLLIMSKGRADSFFSGLFMLFSSAVNLLGMFVALVRGKWRVAGWYGLALLIMIGIGAVTLAFVEIPWNKDE